MCHDVTLRVVASRGTTVALVGGIRFRKIDLGRHHRAQGLLPGDVLWHGQPLVRKVRAPLETLRQIEIVYSIRRYGAQSAIDDTQDHRMAAAEPYWEGCAGPVKRGSLSCLRWSNWTKSTPTVIPDSRAAKSRGLRERWPPIPS